jgi:hypothetical protein
VRAVGLGTRRGALHDAHARSKGIVWRSRWVALVEGSAQGTPRPWRSRGWLVRHGERIPPHRSDVAADPSVSRGLQDTILADGLACTPQAAILTVG